MYESSATPQMFLWYQKLFSVLFLGILIWFALLFFYRDFSYSRLHAVLFVSIYLLTFTGFRVGLYHMIKKGKLLKQKKIVVLGTGSFAKKFYQQYQQQNFVGLKLLGFIGPAAETSLPYLGDLTRLETLLLNKKADEVLVALDPQDEKFNQQINVFLRKELVDVTYLIDLQQSLLIKPQLTEFVGFPAVIARQSPLIGVNTFIKRLFDILFSSLLILLFFPVWFIIPLLIMLESRGGVFYSQKRMGLDGNLFTIWKFRSMKHNAEQKTGAVWAKKNDQRLTRVGKILRKTSLDEFPQFFNVLKGDMSLVGPRPERPELITSFKEKIPFYMSRHKIKAGITGWAQIHGWRGNTSLEKRVEYDLYYIRHWSIFLDIKILFLTLFTGFINKNAY